MRMDCAGVERVPVTTTDCPILCTCNSCMSSGDCQCGTCVPVEVDEPETVEVQAKIDGMEWCPDIRAYVDERDHRDNCDPCGEEARIEADAEWAS